MHSIHSRRSVLATIGALSLGGSGVIGSVEGSDGTHSMSTEEQPAQFSDDFEDGDLSEYQVLYGDRSDWQVTEGIDGRSASASKQDGRSVLVVDPNQYLFGSTRTISFQFQANTSHWKKNAHAFMLDETTVYRGRVAIQGDSLQLRRWPRGNRDESERLEKIDVNVSDGAVHTLEMVIDGTQLELTLDGETSISRQLDEPIGTGTVGFGNGGGIPHETFFDNLQVNESSGGGGGTTMKYDPATHGFGFQNWGTGQYDDHDHLSISRDEARRAIQAWNEPLGEYFDTSLAPVPESTLDLMALVMYVAVNQGTATNGHCYGMVYTSQEYFESPSSIPVEVESPAEIEDPVRPDGSPEPVADDIDQYHVTQLLNFGAWSSIIYLNSDREIDYGEQAAHIMDVIDSRGTAGLGLTMDYNSLGGHQILGYDYEPADADPRNGEEVTFSFYDPNDPARVYDDQELTIDVRPGDAQPVQIYNGWNRLLHVATGTDINPALLAFQGTGSILEFLFDNLVAFFTQSPVRMKATLPDGRTVQRQVENESSGPTEYEGMLFVPDAPEGEVDLELTGTGDGEYTLEAHSAGLDGVRMDETYTGTISRGNRHRFSATVPESAEESGSLEHVETVEGTLDDGGDGGGDDDGFPIWIPLVGGAGVSGYAGYRYLNREPEPQYSQQPPYR